MYNFSQYFFLFMIYSVLGWIFEILAVAITTKKFSNRGFLIGPVCPIYGISVVIMTFLLSKYKNDYIILFCMSFLICTVVEYITSFIMEKIFKMRWWDYSHIKFNINGRVCLQYSILFGIMGIIVVVYINEILLYLIGMVSNLLFNAILIIISIILLADVLISFNVVSKIKKVSVIRKDSTDEINNKIEKFIKNEFVLYKRLLKAFPNLKKLLKK